jgi:hypothetical protein
VHTREASLEPLGYEKITGLSSVKSLTVPARCRTIMMKAEGQSVRFLDTGSNPTATDGFLLDSGEEFLYTGKPQKLRFLELSPSATLHVAYYA